MRFGEQAAIDFILDGSIEPVEANGSAMRIGIAVVQVTNGKLIVVAEAVVDPFQQLPVFVSVCIRTGVGSQLNRGQAGAG